MHTYGYPKLIAQIHLEFADGTAQTIVSDESWKLTAEGPIRASSEFDGEEYDARREMAGWSAAVSTIPAGNRPVWSSRPAGSSKRR